MKVTITYEPGDRVKIKPQYREEFSARGSAGEYTVVRVYATGNCRLVSGDLLSDIAIHADKLEPAPDLLACAQHLRDAVNAGETGMPFSMTDRDVVLARWCLSHVEDCLGLNAEWSKEFILKQLMAGSGELYSMCKTSVKHVTPPATLLPDNSRDEDPRPGGRYDFMRRDFSAMARTPIKYVTLVIFQPASDRVTQAPMNFRGTMFD